MLNLKLIWGLFALLSIVSAQVQFGEPASSQEEDDGLKVRAGLIADALNVHPTGEGGSNPNGRTSGEHCCCASANRRCPNPRNGGLNGGGNNGGGVIGINPRDSLKPIDTRTLEDTISVRIVNNPTDDEPAGDCPRGTQKCCYSDPSDLFRVANVCERIEIWDQKCPEVSTGSEFSRKQCGERSPLENVSTQEGQAKPYEFPWTCLLLNQKNDFLGTCAIIPNDRSNDISRGTKRVITAAHKLKSLQKADLLKVRILEYDASGQKFPETVSHQEYIVKRIIPHPNYDPRSNRLDYDVTLLFVDRTIELASIDKVNAACLPTCSDMFDFQYRNGTGVRCWVAGWGKDAVDGNFQFIQKKVDIPLVPNRGKCESSLRDALARQGNRAPFSLSNSEICAGGIEGKDACTGDGGSPLVCEAKSGRWYVVGLVTWGVGCAESGVPGVYANVGLDRILDFITQPECPPGRRC